MLRTCLLGAIVFGAFTLPIAAQEVYYPGNGVSLPTVIKEVHLLGQTDTKIGIECVVDETGKVTTATVADSPNAALNNAAVRALRQWQFKPGMKNNRPVSVRIFVEVSVARI